jgi:predicted ATPase
MAGPGAAYLTGVTLLPERVPPEDEFPFNVPALRDLNLRFRSAVTFFVGENGTGKSTVLEAIAALARFPISGGGRAELDHHHGPEEESRFARALRPNFRLRPHDGYFLRAEFMAHFASLLDTRSEDPDFGGDPYRRYGGVSLHARSHGEAFLAVLKNRVGEGLFLFDEPESALSPQRQLALLAIMYELAQTQQSQFIVATHSPILLTFPGAEIISFDETPPRCVALEDTSHYQITRGILENPERYWKHLR